MQERNTDQVPPVCAQTWNQMLKLLVHRMTNRATWPGPGPTLLGLIPQETDSEAWIFHAGILFTGITNNNTCKGMGKIGLEKGRR